MPSAQAAGVMGAALGAAVVSVVWAYGPRRPSSSQHESAPATESVPGGAAPVPVIVGSVTARLGEDDRAALRALVREELRAAELAKGPGIDTEPAPKTAEQVPPDQLKAYDSARAMVDRAMRARSYSEDDRTQLRDRLGTLPIEVRFEVMAPLIAAVNRGDVRWQGRGPIF